MKKHSPVLFGLILALLVAFVGSQAGIIPAIVPAAVPSVNRSAAPSSVSAARFAIADSSENLALAGSLTSGNSGSTIGALDLKDPTNGGTLTVSWPGSASNFTINFPAASGMVALTGGGSGGGGGFPGYSANVLTAALTGTIFFPVAGGVQPSGTRANVQANAPYAATGNNLYVVQSVAPGVGNSIAYTIEDAGSATSVTCTISGGSATTCNDTTHTFTAAAGDLLDIKAVVTGTPATTNIQIVFNFGGSAGLTPNGFYLQNGSNYYIGPTFQLATLPTAGSFSWVNQGGATETASGNALVLTGPSGAGDNYRLRCQSISANTTLTTALSCNGQVETAGFCGLAFRESGTGKIETFGEALISTSQTSTPGAVTGSGLILQAVRFTNPTTFSAVQFQQFGLGFLSAFWLQLGITGGNLFFRTSSDGATFSQQYTEAQNAFFTTAPDQFCYAVNANNSVSTQPVSATLFSWKMQ